MSITFLPKIALFIR